MEIHVELKKACMAFELKNGEILLISQEDVNEIAMRLVTEMMCNNRNHVHIHKSSAIEKCNLLYKTITEQRKMTMGMRERYLGKIVDLMDNEDITIETMEESIKKGEKVL